MTGIILPWPRRLTWLFVAALIAVASALALAGVFGWGPTQWTSLTSSMREGVLLPGVVATVAGAWVGRSFSRNSVVAGPSASRVCLAASRQADAAGARVIGLRCRCHSRRVLDRFEGRSWSL